ncbi:type III polyketide synthase [Streptomyces alkaliphilus]|uniref:type III polyketide synthase n=1 Tax=Streptomyces alkaliphilus TaxID=1472722 RepID=UPI002B21C864|nr:type III polyketide synthase [Streptomyces alkaliphilus]
MSPGHPFTPPAAGAAPVITGIGVAVPEPVSQQRLWEDFFREHFADSRLARRVFASAGVTRRHTVVNPLTEPPTHWSTAERMSRYGVEAPLLGRRAVTAALEAADLDVDAVGMLVVASCTGYETPGPDIRIAASLGLRPDTRRLLVGHMGCYAALPGLGSVSDYVPARGRAAVLLCVELTSLHLQPPTTDPQQVVTHALFGDAAVAVVVRPGGSPGDGDPVTGAPGETVPPLEVVDLASHTDAGTGEHMTWRITDLGFRMGLAPEVPDVLAKHVRPVVEELLARNGLALHDPVGWAVHPGGPRILDTVRDELGLPESALASSRAVLDAYGNCSSATVLLVLDHLRGTGALVPGAYAVALAFGPGLTLWAALLRVPGG